MCRHNYIESEKTGVIYCTKCGNHKCKYEVIDKYRQNSTYTGNITSIIYISECVICGGIIKEVI